MKAIKKKTINLAIVAAISGIAITQFAYADLPTAFTNTGSIINTRHNLTQSPLYQVVGQSVNPMNGGRNNYGEVCVYCHTPHGANQANGLVAPLWNRTIRVTNYQTYDELGTTTLTQAVTSTPGSASLTCLSCHDGQTAMDSIINMPGSGRGLVTQATTQSKTFLDTWNNADIVPGSADANNHMGFNSGYAPPPPGYRLGVGDGSDGVGCMSCHSDVGLITQILGFNYADFRMANLGTDLRNDHPIGITFPAPPGSPSPDWNTPAGVKGSSNFFDGNSNGRMEKGEIRTYDGKVECASCHDPHGVPSGGVGTQFNPTFLRKSQSAGGLGSAVCLTCHVK